MERCGLRLSKAQKVGEMRLLRGVAATMAMRAKKRYPDSELRELADDLTEWELDSYELDKLVRLVKEHPAYNALPELAEE